MELFTYECGCRWDSNLPFCPLPDHGAPLVSHRQVQADERQTYQKFQDWVVEANNRQTGMTPRDYVNRAIRTDMNFKQYELIPERLKDRSAARLLHAVMGLVTEAGEMMDTLKRYLIYGKPIDWTNVIEELGDSQWYTALAIDNCGEVVPGITYESIWDKNIRKLVARYPDKFSEDAALNRKLDEERKQLES